MIIFPPAELRRCCRPLANRWCRLVTVAGGILASGAASLGGLQVVQVEPAGGATRPADILRVRFNEAVQEGSFMAGDVRLLTPGGVAVPATAVQPLDASTYEIRFGGATSRAVYALIIGPEVASLTGAWMDEDQDGTPGEADADAYRVRVVADDTVMGAAHTSWEGENLTVAALLTVQGNHVFRNVAVWSGGSFALAQSVGLSGDLTLRDGGGFSLAGGAVIEVAGQINVGTGSTLTVQGRDVEEPVGGVWVGRGGTVRAGGVIVAAGGRISADGGGYLERAGPGYSANRAGTHGGRGRENPALPYGFAELPVDLGSGGHYTTRGGGAIHLVVTNVLRVDGEISADGVSWGSQGYGSAGGSIWIETDVLGGGGMIHANGSTRGATDGGGGRVAVYARDVAEFAGGDRIRASAGGPTGQDGTALLFDTSRPGRHVTVLERHETEPGSTVTFDTLRLPEGAVLDLGGGADLAVGGSLNLASNAVIYAHGTNQVEPVDGQWLGRGVTIRAGEMTVAQGARVSANGEGYVERAGPGYSANNPGTHGGRGRSNPKPPYGLAEQPVELGSGGHYTTLGGGAIRLVVAGALSLDGEVSADGLSWGSQGYGSAGGSLWIEAGTLSGGGAIHANGSTRGGQDGGGGRVAVYARDLAAFADLRRITASAGGPEGQHGTALILDTSRPGKHLQVFQRHALEADEVRQADSLALREGATLDLGGGASLSLAGAMTLETNTVVLFRGKNTGEKVDGQWQGRGAALFAGSLSVAEGARLSADGLGYEAKQGPGASTGAEGVHGGRVRNNPAEPYGSPTEPVDLGSAGGSYTAGGGAIRLVVTNLLRLDGLITANASTWYTYGGRSAGGSVWIDAGQFAGQGIITANGDAHGARGGSGGRIAVYYDDASQWSGLSGSGALSQAADAEHGTAYFIHRGTGTTTLANGFTLLDDAHFAFPNLTLASNAVVTLGGGSWVDVPGTLRVSAGARLVLGGKNTLLQVNEEWAGEGCRMVVGELIVEAGGRISADGQGYAASDSGQPFRYTGSGPGGGGENGGGGGHGGRGGFVNRGRTYGSEWYPTDPGSGGGGVHSTARGGGALQITAGRMVLDGLVSADGLQNDYGWNRGGGSGGSLWVSAGIIEGGGALTADGGHSAFWAGEFTDGGGGGGRIALYAADSQSFSGATACSAAPGTGLNPQAEAGTVRIVNQPEFHVQVDDEFCHGTETVGFLALGVDFRGLSVRLEVASGGAPVTLATAASALDDVVWDTTALADGRYTLQAVFSRAGQTVGEAMRPVVVLNNVRWHGGEVAADETWEPGSLHLIEGRLHVPAGIRVALAAGAVVKVLDDAIIHLADGGTLDVQGTETQLAVLTSIHDDLAGGDTNFDGAATKPEPASWRLRLGSQGILNLSPHTHVAGGLVEQSGRTLAADTAWRAGLVYHLTGTTIIPTNVTLRVEAGTVTKLNGAEIQVQAGGRVEALGTPERPVVFTSLADDQWGGDSNRDGAESAPKAGDWRGLKCLGGELDLTAARLLYAGAGNESMVRVHGGGVVRLRDCQLRHTTQEGVSQREGAGSVSLVNCLVANTTVALHALSGTNVAVNCTLVDNATGVLAAGTAGVSLVNSLLAHGSQYGVRISGAPPPTLRHCNVWGFQRGNYSGVASQTGKDGNLSANPFLMLRAHHDFRPNPRSPLIDAADGLAAPDRDHFGLARNLQTNRPPTGVPTPDGLFADIGAFEFNRATAPDVDLAVTEVVGPVTADVGGQVSVRWRVTNLGSQPVTGPWFDEVSLAWDPTRTPLVVPLGEALVAQGVTLEPGASYEHAASFRVPGCEPREYHCQVTADSRAEVYEADRRTNNLVWSPARTAVRLPTLELDGTPFTGELIAGQPVWLRLLPAVDEHLELRLQFGRPDTVAPMYLAAGFFPSTHAFEQRSGGTATNQVTLRIENASPQPYYLRIEPEKLGSASVPFTLSASRLPFAVTSVQPAEAGTGVPVTLTLEGQGFPRELAVSALTAGGVEVPATAVQYVSSARGLATFTFTHDQAGPADLRFQSAKTPELLLEKVLTVVSGGAPEYYVEVDAPEALRAGRSHAITIRWGNRGVVDAPILLLEIRAPEGVELFRQAGGLRVQDRLWLFTTQPGVTGPFMAPGFEGRRTLHIKATQAGPFELSVSSWPVGDAVLREYPVDWNQLERRMRRPAIPDEAWQSYWTRLKERLGSTSAELVKRLADQAVAITAAADEPDASGVDFLEAMLREISAALAERPRVARHEGGGEAGGGRVHALLVASADYTEYSDGGRDLNAGLTDVNRWENYYTAVAQATDIQTITDRAEWESWSEDDGDVLGPGQRTGYNSIFPHEGAEYLLSAIDDLGESAQPGDTIVFHYSGHATAGGLQLAERDYDNGYVLPFEDIYAALADTQAETIVVTLDACKSGGMIDTLRTWESSRLANLAMGTNRFYVPEPYIPYEKWVFMTAADGLEGAYDDVLRGGGLMSQRMLTQLVNDWDPVSVPEAYQAMVAEGKLEHDEKFGIYDGAAVSNGLRGNHPKLLCTDPDFSLVGLDEYGEGKDEMPTSASSVVPDPEENPSSGPTVRHRMESVRPVDPNEKQTTGVGMEGYVTGTTPIAYTIFFENDPKAGATAPVQELLVTDSLSSSLDWSTLELVALQFGRTAVTLPPGRDVYHDVLQAPRDPYPVFTDVTLDQQTGVLTLLMRSVDTATKDLPLDAWAGFLPVNDETGKGQGSLSFRIRPKPGLANGTRINNTATITFDPTYGVNPSIRTATVRNTLDTQAPVSRVDALPATSQERFTLTWSGSDPGGSGIETYDVYRAVDRGPYELWLAGVSRTGIVFTGELGRTYSFFSVARDRVGHVEPMKSAGEAWTQVTAPAPAYFGWLAGYFTTEELSDPGAEDSLWGLEADAESDGRANVIEYFAGGNPRLPGDAPLIEIVVVGDTLELSYREAKGVSNLRAVIEWSSDLETWLTEGLVEGASEDLGTAWRRRVTLPLEGAGWRFIRLNLAWGG